MRNYSVVWLSALQWVALKQKEMENIEDLLEEFEDDNINMSFRILDELRIPSILLSLLTREV